jgi:hypothetical protein
MGNRDRSIALLVLNLGMSWRSAPRLDRFIPGKNSGSHWVGAYAGPRAGLDIAENVSLYPLLGFKPSLSGMYNCKGVRFKYDSKLRFGRRGPVVSSFTIIAYWAVVHHIQAPKN